MKASDYIFDYLKSKGIDTVFMVSGGAAAHLMDSAKKKQMNYVCNYHEQACAMSAEGYARIAKKPACVLVTNGPGSSNTVTGVLGAFQDSIPMIVISGQVPTNQSMASLNTESIRQLGVQECNIIEIVKSITKYAVQVRDANTLQYHLEKAYNLATTGRMGPVWLDIPLDVQSTDIQITSNEQEETCENFSEYDIQTIVDLMFSSKNPVIVTGNGIHLSNTEDSFKQLKDTLNVPVVSSWTSRDMMSHDDANYIGNFGLFGERAANFAVQKADFLLVLGCRLSIPNTGYQTKLFSPNSKKVMVDIDRGEINKHTLKIDIPVIDSLTNFIPKLLNAIESRDIPDWSEWVSKTNKWKNKYPVILPEYENTSDRINSFYFMGVLSENVTENSVVVTDMGTSFTCTMQSFKTNGKSRLFTSSGCCSMGFGLCGAIGSYFADKSKDIVLIAGDGGFQMNIQELQTVVHHNIPVKMFILNNNGYLAISSMQDNLFRGDRIASTPSTGVSCPNFMEVAKAYGIESIRVSNSKDLNANIQSIMKKNTPVLCEIMMVENQLLIPRVQSQKTSEGKIVSGSLENMYPYLSQEELRGVME